YWTFAHNGQINDFAAGEGPFQPVGNTDSEAIFCDLLNRLRARFTQRPSQQESLDCLTGACADYARRGVCNLLLSNGMAVQPVHPQAVLEHPQGAIRPGATARCGDGG